MIAIAVFFVFFITSCQHNSENASLYLSIAATYYDDGVGPEKGMSTLIYQYNLNKDTGKTVDKVKYKSQYPLAIYSEEENVIYYTSYDKINRGDQIWSYNIGNKTTVELTTNISVVNYIIPRKEYIVIIGRERGERRIKPMIYDKVTKEVYDVETPEIDFQCNICTYNPITETILMIGTSEVQADEISKNWNEGGGNHNPEPYYPPDTYIYKLNEKNAELILKLNRYDVYNISSDLEGNIYYCGVTERYSDVPVTHYRYMIKSNQIEEFVVMGNDSPFHIREDYSENEIVFRGSAKNEEEEERYPYGIYRYNINTKEFKLILNYSC
jgi:phage terminase large subunit-like protein